ncbi:probable assembly chaperone of rpl4 isoform X2 [Hyalella azteca]|uniref:Probable assembly chaperone of rpl4 isoform X2 n=1 Tax=Hyalella azteca TaxID=294128 RepID=A0A8B7PDC4_HYAAZ|nr:probable assembly chaperone of rpl4 isoform X2 [Hyalella azteca]
MRVSGVHTARYLNIIGEVVQAKTVLEESRPLWTVEFQEDGSKASELPAPLRLAAAKLFIELEMHEDAQSILDSLLDESDQVVEVHYLSGWNSYLQGQEHHSDALLHLKNAKTCESQFPCDDPELVEHISDLLAELGYDASQEEEDDEDGWTDAEDEQEMEREIIEEAGEASDDDL